MTGKRSATGGSVGVGVVTTGVGVETTGVGVGSSGVGVTAGVGFSTEVTRTISTSCTTVYSPLQKDNSRCSNKVTDVTPGLENATPSALTSTPDAAPLITATF